MEYKGFYVLMAAAVFWGGMGVCPADTYVLGADQEWTNVSDNPETQYLPEISRIKSAIAAGDAADARDALEALRRDYPDMAGPDLDAFVEAEMYFADAKWTKAVRKYRQFLTTYPDSPLYRAALERLYAIGAGFLAGQKQTILGFLKVPAWDTGADMMQEVADKASTSLLAYRALKTLAQAQDRKKLYMEAYQTWAEIEDRWPGGEIGMEALVMMAQTLHTAYTDPESDASVLRGARTYYESFVQKYPEAAEDYKVAEIIDLIRQQMAYKQYHVGMYYDRTGNPQAAGLYYQQVIEKWPGTEAAMMAEARIQSLKSGEPFQGPNTAGRKLFRLGNAILDSWFGLDAFLDLPSPEKREGIEADATR